MHVVNDMSFEPVQVEHDEAGNGQQGPKEPTTKENNESKLKRPKRTEIKAQKAKMKGNRGPKGQNERKLAPREGGGSQQNPWV